MVTAMAAHDPDAPCVERAASVRYFPNYAVTACFLDYRSETARQVADRFRRCATDSAAQTPLGLNAECKTVFIARRVERPGIETVTPGGALDSHPHTLVLAGITSGVGLGLPIVSRLLGHGRLVTTAIYAPCRRQRLVGGSREGGGKDRDRVGGRNIIGEIR